MFLTDPSTNELPQIIPLPGAQPYKLTQVPPALHEPFINIYPEAIALPNLWDKSIPDIIPPDLGNDSLGEKLQWNGDSVNPAHYTFPLSLTWSLDVQQKTAALYLQSSDALTIGYELDVSELITVVELDALYDAANIATEIICKETTTAAFEAVTEELVDIGFELSVSET